MKLSVIFSMFLLASMFSVSVMAQDAKEDKSKRPSPPAVAEGVIDGVTVKIDYSQPSAKGRKMLGGKEAYGTVWRTGANETTSISFSAPVKLEGKDLAAGTYALFSIPGEKEWVIIINKTIKWGHYSYNQSEDVLRVNVVPTTTDKFVETFNIAIVKNQVVMKWENTQVAFTVSKK